MSKSYLKTFQNFVTRTEMGKGFVHELVTTHFKIRSPSSGQFSKKYKLPYIACYTYLLMLN